MIKTENSVPVSYTHLDVYKRQAVDRAEDEVEACTKVNVDGTKNIANVCKELNIPMMYFSTDYVFDGQGDQPWHEYDKRHPLNV